MFCDINVTIYSQNNNYIVIIHMVLVKLHVIKTYVKIY